MTSILQTLRYGEVCTMNNKNMTNKKKWVTKMSQWGNILIIDINDTDIGHKTLHITFSANSYCLVGDYTLWFAQREILQWASTLYHKC